MSKRLCAPRGFAKAVALPLTLVGLLGGCDDASFDANALSLYAAEPPLGPREGGLQLAPNSNLVSYIGCLADTAHTTDPSGPYCNVPCRPLDAPLIHPSTVERSLAADLFEFYRTFLWKDEEESDRRSLG